MLTLLRSRDREYNFGVTPAGAITTDNHRSVANFTDSELNLFIDYTRKQLWGCVNYLIQKKQKEAIALALTNIKDDVYEKVPSPSIRSVSIHDPDIAKVFGVSSKPAPSIKGVRGFHPLTVPRTTGHILGAAYIAQTHAAATDVGAWALNAVAQIQ